MQSRFLISSITINKIKCDRENSTFGNVENSDRVIESLSCYFSQKIRANSAQTTTNLFLTLSNYVYR